MSARPHPKPRPSFKPALSALLAIALLTPHAGWSQATPSAPRALPSLGDGGGMSLSEERDLGDRIARELYRDPAAVDDPILSEYLDQIWQRLLMAARQRGEMPPELDARMAWRVVQIRDRAVNAFALPGGYLGIQYGLIAATQDRDELATVMGHELSHVTQRHIARSIDQQSKLTPLVLATMLIGAMAASRNPSAGEAIMVGSQAAAIQKGLNFSRDMEREADRIGYAVMTQAGYSPDGAVRMFERLQAASRLNDSGAWPYLRTHPLTTERIGDMQSRQALRHGTHAKPAQASDDLEHQMMAARARVLAETGIDELRTATRLPETRDFASQTPSRRAAMLYEAAMAHAALRDWPKARQTAAQLAELVKGQDAPSAQARLLQADLAWRAGDAPGALGLLPAPAAKSVSGSLSAADVLGSAAVDQANWRSQGTASQASNGKPAAAGTGIQGRTAVLWRAIAQLHSGQSAQVAAATSALQSWVATHPNDALAWQTLSQAWEAQGNRLRALRAQAEARIAQADWQGARDRLQAAQEATRKSKPSTPGDHIEASIIDTRYQQASDKVKAQAEADARQR